MLIPNIASVVKYTYTGINTLNIPFPFYRNNTIRVQTASGDDADPISVTLTYGLHYSITGISAGTFEGAQIYSSGTLTFTTAGIALLTRNWVIAIYRDTPEEQQFQYNELDNFPAKSHENALGKLTVITQELQEQVSRTIRVSITNKNPPATAEDFYQEMQDFANEAAASAISAAESATDAASSAQQAGQYTQDAQKIYEKIGDATTDSLTQIKTATTGSLTQIKTATDNGVALLSTNTNNGLAFLDAKGQEKLKQINTATETGLVKVDESVSLARKWATNPEDSPVKDGEFSAYHWAKKAQQTLTAAGYVDYTLEVTNASGLVRVLYASIGHPQMDRIINPIVNIIAFSAYMHTIAARSLFGFDILIYRPDGTPGVDVSEFVDCGSFECGDGTQCGQKGTALIFLAVSIPLPREVPPIPDPPPYVDRGTFFCGDGTECGQPGKAFT